MPYSLTQRLKSLLPRGWFSDEAEVLGGVLAAAADTGQHSRDLIAYADKQTRLATASDGFLDMVAYDYLGARGKRRPGESDASYMARIQREILRERGTRAGLKAAVEDLTGNPVRVFEPWNPTDCGGYDTGYLGFDVHGRYGSVEMPYEMFLATLHPKGAGLPNLPGLDDGGGGLDTAPEEFGDIDEVSGPVTQQDIYDTINGTRAAGITVWTAIGYPAEGQLDHTFILDQSELVGP